jgi:cell division protein FtsQ
LNKIKTILPYILWTISIALIGVILSFSVNRQKNLKIDKINISIENTDEQQFLEEKNIIDLIKINNDSISTKKINQLNVYQLEKIVNSHPAIENANVSVDINGDLNIEVEQRQPIARIFNANNESYYIDKNGKAMPLSDQYTAKILPFNGNINEPFNYRVNYNVAFFENNKKLKNLVLYDDIFNIANYISKDSVLSALVQQVFVAENKTFEIITAITQTKVILGDSQDLDSKFKKLKIFFKEGLAKNNWWNKYNTIDISFKNQIICKK